MGCEPGGILGTLTDTACRIGGAGSKQPERVNRDFFDTCLEEEAQKGKFRFTRPIEAPGG